MKLIAANIFHIVKVIGKEEAWDHICIGSDFDGAVNYFEAYESVEDFDTLSEDLFAFLEAPQDIKEINMTSQKYIKLKFGLTSREIVEKIMYKSMDGFLKRYFTDQYLEIGENTNINDKT